MNLVDEITDYDALPALYEAAQLGNRKPEEVIAAFKNSSFRVAIYDDEKQLIAAGRAFGDGVDCAVICDMAVLPSHQGQGLGTKILNRLVERTSHHLRVILYAAPGKEAFYKANNFHMMKTAMMTSTKLPLELGRQSGFIE